MAAELQVTLSPEIAAIVVREAARQGTSADAVANAVIRERYTTDASNVEEPLSRGSTLADRLAKHLGVIDTGGANLSTDTSKKFADALYEERLRKQTQ
jgi:hypothetical protein